MNKTTQSILLAAMLAASGFAVAQNPAAPATRADVKAQAPTAETERKAGTGEPIKPNTSGTMQGNTSGTTRADVKSQAPNAETERKAGTGEPIKPNASGSTATQGNTSGTSRADVKSEVGTEPRRLGTGEVAKSGGTTASTTSAERKRMRDERRAMNKADRDAKMGSGSTMTPAPKTDKAP